MKAEKAKVERKTQLRITYILNYMAAFISSHTGCKRLERSGFYSFLNAPILHSASRFHKKKRLVFLFITRSQA